MVKKFGFSKQVAVLFLSVLAALFGSGCNPTFNLIDHVSFLPTANLESVRVSVVFANTIQTNLSGSFTVGGYGFLFVNPFTPTQPFEVGFSLDTSVANDQNYVKLTPTLLLPNGLPTGIRTALVQLQDATPISSQFDLYAYVDVLNQSWLGAAAVFSFINDQYFPNGLSVSQVFLRDAAGDPGVIASVFGPSVDSTGKITRAGGIALFANVKLLIASGTIGAHAKAVTYRPEPIPLVAGPRAAQYEGQYTQLRALESGLVRAFNKQD